MTNIFYRRPDDDWYKINSNEEHIPWVPIVDFLNIIDIQKIPTYGGGTGIQIYHEKNY